MAHICSHCEQMFVCGPHKKEECSCPQGIAGSRVLVFCDEWCYKTHKAEISIMLGSTPLTKKMYYEELIKRHLRPPFVKPPNACEQQTYGVSRDHA